MSGLKRFLKDASITYGSDYDEMAKVIVCESGWQTDQWSDNLSSYGVAQFFRPTFDENCKGSYNNPHDQLTCMAKIWNKLEKYKGKLRKMKERWDCYWITKKPG